MRTFEQALDLQKRTREVIGKAPFIVVLNKIDLEEEWKLGEAQMEELKSKGWEVLQSSAKLGTGVDEAFQKLTEMMLNPNVS